VQPEFEAGLEITRQALLHLNISATEIQRFTDAVRREQYAPLYSRHDDYATVVQLGSASRLLELNWVKLENDSPLAGHTIQALRIRSETGVSVVGVMRAGELHPNPAVEFRFAAGDMVAVMGDTQHLAAFQVMATARIQLPLDV
jgi:CPA2 family monovalent cation:H+ antiporter-2